MTALPYLSTVELQLLTPLLPALALAVCSDGEPEALRQVLEHGIPVESGWTPPWPVVVDLDNDRAWNLKDGTTVPGGLALQEQILWSRTGRYRLLKGHLQPAGPDLVRIEVAGRLFWGRGPSRPAPGEALMLAYESYLSGWMPIVEIKHVWPL